MAVNKELKNQTTTWNFKRKKWLEMSQALIKTIRKGYEVKPRGTNKKLFDILVSFKNKNEKGYEKFKQHIIAGEVRGLNYITFTQIMRGQTKKVETKPKMLLKIISRYN